MATKSYLVSCALLRLLTLGALTAAIVVLATNQFRSVLDDSETTFKDVIAYRYVIAAASIGCLYTLIQLPFAIFHANKGKRLIQNDFLPNFDFYGDKVVAFMLASAAGGGFAVTLDLKRVAKYFYDAFRDIIPGIDEEESKNIKFFNKAYIASGFVLLGCACMVVLSIFSSLNKSNKPGFFGSK